MIAIRPSAERGRLRRGWLDTYYTFSFADYVDPNHMGFRALRVLNEDVFGAGKGFGRHGHREMEILTVVLSGALRHEDSLGHVSTLRPGEIQRMSAGTGIEHSEVNAAPDAPVHLLQIWLLPGRAGLKPGYEQKPIPVPTDPEGWSLLATPDGRDGSATVHQDVAMKRAVLAPGGSARHALAPGRHAWIQVAEGAVNLNGHALSAGDGAAVSDEDQVVLQAGPDGRPADVFLFDLA